MPLFGVEWLEFRNGLVHTEELDLRIRIAVLTVNVLITPVVLVLYSVRAYLLPCIQALVTSVLWRFMFTEEGCIDCFRSWLFEDREFKPSDDSIGEARLRGKVRWARAREIVTKAEQSSKNPNKVLRGWAKLFEGGIAASDICQGALGDCWLLSALAALSERPHIIRRAFLTDSWNPRGKYRIRLWSEWEKRYVIVCVDDLLPVDATSGRPLFTQPRGNELWVMIMEKAFAKLFGSYGNISGGHPLFALRTITGDESFKYSLSADAGKWRKLTMRIELGENSKAEQKRKAAGSSIDYRSVIPSSTSTAGSKPDVGFYYSTKDGDLDGDQMYSKLDKLSRSGCIMTAGTTGRDATLEEGREGLGASGIVPGHAYSILSVYTPKLTLQNNIKLVKLRNPWGKFEWSGDWSDNSDLWKKHPNVQVEMGLISGRSAADDGVFFMSWSDFQRHFDSIDVCMLSRSLDDFQLDEKEDLGTCGPTVGCCLGCGRYWLCCCGVYKLWCSRDSSLKEAAVSPV